MEMVFLALLLATNAGVAVWQLLQQRTWKKRFSRLENRQQVLDDTLSALVSAGLAVDKRIERLDAMLVALKERRAPVTPEPAPEPSPPPPKSTKAEEPGYSPYESAIQRAKLGASVELLVEEFGLSRGEAELLVRMHAPKQRVRS